MKSINATFNVRFDLDVDKRGILHIKMRTICKHVEGKHRTTLPKSQIVLLTIRGHKSRKIEYVNSLRIFTAFFDSLSDDTIRLTISSSLRVFKRFSALLKNLSPGNVASKSSLSKYTLKCEGKKWLTQHMFKDLPSHSTLLKKLGAKSSSPESSPMLFFQRFPTASWCQIVVEHEGPGFLFPPFSF